MWGQVDGENKIVIARRAVGNLIDGLPDASEVGLIAHGHRREGDCDDIEVLRGVAPGTHELRIDEIRGKRREPEAVVVAGNQTTIMIDLDKE